MDKSHSKRTYIRIISFLSVLSILLGAWGAVNAVRFQRYRRQSQLSSERALSELCENLDAITVSLHKGMYTSNKASLSDISKELSKCSVGAKISLASVTNEELITDEIYKFLSQVGDFTASLLRKAENGEKLTTREREVIEKLFNYSASLSDSVGKIRSGLLDGTVAIEKSLSNLSLSEEEAALFDKEMISAEQSLEDFPTLIYDGPFSDNLLEKEPMFTKGKSEITANEAKKKAAEILGCETSALRQDSDEKSRLELYCFSAGEKAIAITKRGGHLCYLTNPDFSGEAAISEKEAVKRAKAFLDKLGYKSMKESYYSDYDGVCTINFAYQKDGVVYYGDLIKVSVALDSGKVVAADARTFIMNHKARKLPEIKVSVEKAKKALAGNLTLLGSQTALIPTEYGTERLCHELHCIDAKKQEVLIYTDVETGEEADILLLMYADGGTLAK